MNRLHATKDFWLASLRADSPALQDAVSQAGPGAAVPSCPGWTVADLVEHLAFTLRWVRETAPRGVVTRPESAAPPVSGSALPPGREPSASPDPSPSGDPSPGLDPSAGGKPSPVLEPSQSHSPGHGLSPGLEPMGWSESLDRLHRELTGTIETLEALDADFPAWNWAPQAKTAAFWQRRMAHEVSVHRWDAEAAAGRPTPIETKLAADGVSEVLDSWLPAGKRRGPTDLHGVAHLVATDAGYEWFVRLRGMGVALLDTGTILDTDDHHPRAEAAGTASDLLLVLMGRQRSDRLSVTGNPRLLEALRTG